MDYLAGELARDDLMQLRREAMLTPFPEDDTLVARMLAREDERRTLEASLQGLRQAQNAARLRAAEVDALRQDFKRNRYDRAGSTFGDDALVATMLTQFLNGLLDRNRHVGGPAPAAALSSAQVRPELRLRRLWRWRLGRRRPPRHRARGLRRFRRRGWGRLRWRRWRGGFKTGGGF